MSIVWQLFWRVDFFFFVGASRVCSSHSIHGVFLSGFGMRSSRLVGFPLINRATLFFLINRKGKAFASFKEKTKSNKI
jgi:hypothetical protein